MVMVVRWDVLLHHSVFWQDIPRGYSLPAVLFWQQFVRFALEILFSYREVLMICEPVLKLGVSCQFSLLHAPLVVRSYSGHALFYGMKHFD